MSSITLTDNQFKELLSSLNPAMARTAQPSDPDSNHTLKDPAALGPMQPLNLGANKMARLKIFDEWLEEATNRMDYIGVSSSNVEVRNITYRMKFMPCSLLAPAAIIDQR